MFLPDML